MKAPWIERFLFWFCDTFGHAKSGYDNAEWNYKGYTHYHCKRCQRIVSLPITPHD